MMDEGEICQVILAVGHQDIDATGLQPPAGVEIIGASSDHLVVKSTNDYRPLALSTNFNWITARCAGDDNALRREGRDNHNQ